MLPSTMSWALCANTPWGAHVYNPAILSETDDMNKLQLAALGEERLYPEGQARDRPHVHWVTTVPPTGVKLQRIPIEELAEQLRVICVPTNATAFFGTVTRLFCPMTPVHKTTE